MGALLALVVAACSGGSPEKPPYDDLLGRGIDHGFPAMVLLVDRPGREVWIGAAGLANLEEDLAVLPGDLFHLASISKLPTAATVLSLVDEGRLSLDDRVVDLLDPARLAKVPHIDEVSVRQLLDHTSGLYGFNNDLDYLATVIGPRAAESVVWEPWDLVALADGDRVAPFGRPGEARRYGDTNYVLLGLIVEAVTGEPFGEVLRSRVLEPLGMSSTALVTRILSGDAEPPGRPVEGYARLSDELLSYWQVPEEVFPPIEGDEGLRRTTLAGERLDTAAGLLSNAGDLHRFAEALFRGDLLSRESRHWLLSVAEGLDDELVGSDRAAVLWAYRLTEGTVVTAEGDGPGGSNTVLAFHPESGTIVVVLTNIFGLGDELDFIIREIVGPAVER